MKQALYNLCGVLALGLCLIADAHASPIYVFTNVVTPVAALTNASKATITVIPLGALKKMVQRFNQTLNELSPAEAEKRAQVWFLTHQADLHRAVHNERLAEHFNITQIPTIVFDNGAFKVLGQTDILVALRQFRQWQQQKRTQVSQNTRTSSS